MSLEGIAELPLHRGHVPQWLAQIMKRLAKAIIEVMVDEFSVDKVVERLSNPLWFQALNNVIGMDWDSSGSTTVTLGILKEVTWKNPDLGIIVLGGKGARARKVPEELDKVAELYGLNTSFVDNLKKTSRLIAKIDSALLQDKYTLYHHSLIISSNRRWCIIQQGMNIEVKMARRYHWYMPKDYYNDPHKAVSGTKHSMVLNLVSRLSHKTRKTIIDIVNEKPIKTINDYVRAYSSINKQNIITMYLLETRTGVVGEVKSLNKRITLYKPLPTPRELLNKLKKVYEIYPRDISSLLLIRGVNDKVIRALALISDLIYNEPPDTNDPVTTPYDPFKYAYAIGGKDGVPYPINRKHAEEVVITLEEIIREAKLGRKEKLIALRGLSKIRINLIK